MKITVIAHPGSSKQEIVCKDGVYHVYVTAVAKDGEANTAITAELAQYFAVAKSFVVLQKGVGVKQKLYSIES